jgi:secondary thiamine-phosphate synthase enzyme
MVHQCEINLPVFKRGFHLITHLIEKQIIGLVQTGFVQVFVKHTSVAITINENADPTVLTDMEEYFDRLAPEDQDYFEHTLEGPDDMPAHIKTTLIGHSVSIPITNGRLNLGTWQGIYLCEFRSRAQARKLIITVVGE